MKIKAVIVLVFFLSSCVSTGSFRKYSPRSMDLRFAKNDQSAIIIASITESGNIQHFMLPAMFLDMTRVDNSQKYTLSLEYNKKPDEIIFPFRPLRKYVRKYNLGAETIVKGGFLVYRVPAGTYTINGYSGYKSVTSSRHLVAKSGRNLGIRFTVRPGQYLYIGNYHFHYTEQMKYRFSVAVPYRRDISMLRRMNALLSLRHIDRIDMAESIRAGKN